MTQGSLEERTFERVRTALTRVKRSLATSDVQLDSSVIDDLGIDSLRFVDLTLALEDALGVENLPLEDWYDAESAGSGKRFTVASLVAVCIASARGSE